MTVTRYPVGDPPAAAQMGAICRARDLAQGRNILGAHRFASPDDCQIDNGLLRLTLSAAGTTPTLTVEGWRPPVTIGDTYGDTYEDVYPGTLSTPEWVPMGALVIDSPAVTALLVAVTMLRRTDGRVSISLAVPAVGDVVVTIHQGESLAHVQHGADRITRVTTTRRLRWTDDTPPSGDAKPHRIDETEPPATDGYYRFVAGVTPVTTNPGAFSVTSASLPTARFGFGLSTAFAPGRPQDMHPHLGNTSRLRGLS